MIHSFSATNGGAYYPVGGITQGADGYYYGTTYYGGFAYNAGTIYRKMFEARSFPGVTLERILLSRRGRRNLP